MRSGIEATRVCRSWNSVARRLRASSAEVSAPRRRSIRGASPAMNSSAAIQTLATSTSTATIAENTSSPTSKTSFMAAWLAPPPIQLPATVANPRQMASGPTPPTVSGLMKENTRIANGPPSTMLTVAVANMISACGPSRMMPGMSMLSVRSTSVAGSKYREDTKYRLDASASTMPNVLYSDGMK